MEHTSDMSQIYGRISPELDKQFRHACAERRISRPQGLVEAIQEWLRAPSTSDIHPGPTKAPIEIRPVLESQFQRLLESPGNRKLAEMFAGILQTGPENARKALAENLAVFADYTEVKAELSHRAKRRPR